MKPQFSVVIPTYNRCDLVGYAIESALTQTCADLEVVVSDNWSEDATRDVVACYDDKRLRYVRPASHLLADEHWEFARTQAMGRYIIILGDDDALAPIALDYFAQGIAQTGAEFLLCSPAHYFIDAFHDVPADTLKIRAFTGDIRRVDAREEFLEPLFTLKTRFDMHPSFYLYAAALADRIAAKVGRFHHAPLAEFTAFPMAAAHASVMALIDRPLCVVGHTAKSHGTRLDHEQTDKPSYQSVMAQLVTELPLSPVKLTIYSYFNYIAESLLHIKQLDPDTFATYAVDETAFAANIYRELLQKQELGSDMKAQLAIFMAYLDSRPTVHDVLFPPPPPPPPRTLKSVIGDLGTRRVRNWLFPRPSAPPPPPIVDEGPKEITLDTRELQLRTILDCIAYVARMETTSVPTCQPVDQPLDGQVG